MLKVDGRGNKGQIKCSKDCRYFSFNQDDYACKISIDKYFDRDNDKNVTVISKSKLYILCNKRYTDRKKCNNQILFQENKIAQNNTTFSQDNSRDIIIKMNSPAQEGRFNS